MGAPQGLDEKPSSLINGFLSSVARQPSAPALVVDGASKSYIELLGSCRKISAAVHALSSRPFCAVLGAGTSSVYESLLGVLFAGRGYLPLNPSFPVARTAYMLAESEVDLVFVDALGERVLPDLLALVKRPLTIVLAEASDASRLGRRHARVDFLAAPGLDALAEAAPAKAKAPAVPLSPGAYLMFTSGSTGRPKGVVIDHANVRNFIESIVALYDFGAEDRFSQMFDLTFDLSVFDMFVCWESGASLWVVPPRSRLAPSAFVRRSGLTVWFSVPAVAAYMKQLGALRPGNFPTLRHSLFCGEALPVTIAEDWQQAAPRSQLHNLYGPTELTIACTHYAWKGKGALPAGAGGLVPIGNLFPGLESAIVDASLRPVPNGETGELCVRGEQTSPGYWRRPELTARKFVAMPWVRAHERNRWYRTGDRVRCMENGELLYVGRIDHQVKISGYRVELGELEAQLREIAKTELAVAVPLPTREGESVSGLVACLCGSAVDGKVILRGCAEMLPRHMVPRSILKLETMPLNANGKIDRNALSSLVGEVYGLRQE